MDLSKAFTLSISEIDKPVLSLYEIEIAFYYLYVFKKYKNEKILKLTKHRANISDLHRHLDKLKNEGILSELT